MERSCLTSEKNTLIAYAEDHCIAKPDSRQGHALKNRIVKFFINLPPLSREWLYYKM